MTDVEAVILTGGSSRRMGVDKATLLVDGEPIVTRLVRLCFEAGLPVTVLGPGGQADPDPGSGPLAALAAFTPTAEWIFVASCDLPLFDPRLVAVCSEVRADGEAVVPLVDGRLQPLCGLYHATALHKATAIHQSGGTRIMSWVDALNVVPVSPEMLAESGLNPDCVRSANTPTEWEALLEKRSG